jgi:hypothetical protein
MNQATNALFFAAGPNDESHGLYGRIEALVTKSDEQGGQDADDNDQD